MMSDARRYIDGEFEKMARIGIKGDIETGLKATFKMCFLCGMAAALSFDGNDIELVGAIRPAMEAISEQFGGRTIFPIGDSGDR
jgi:hypothetical protein